MRHYSAKLQTTKKTLTTSKYSIEFTYSGFPCHLKVDRTKLSLINRRWKCKKGIRLTSDYRRSLIKLTFTAIPPVLFPAVTVTVVGDRKTRNALIKNQSDCRIRYRALFGENKMVYFYFLEDQGFFPTL